MISVIMPMKNAATYVEAAARSVLDQTEPLELIVIDDGSTDGSADIVARLKDSRVRLIPGPATGISAAMNEGLRVARGDIVVRCDADDLLPGERLQWQSQWLNEHPEYVAVCGFFATLTSRGKLLAELKLDGPSCEISEELRSGITRTHLNAYAIRTAALQAIGGFRPYFTTAEDIDLQLRLIQAGRVWYEARLAYWYRLHDKSITHSQPDPARKHFEQTARDFQRQRQSGDVDALTHGQAPPLPEGTRPPPTAREQAQGHLLARAWRERRGGRRSAAMRTGLRACLQRPAAWRVWKSCLILSLGAIASALARQSSDAN